MQLDQFGDRAARVLYSLHAQHAFEMRPQQTVVQAAVALICDDGAAGELHFIFIRRQRDRGQSNEIDGAHRANSYECTLYITSNISTVSK